MCGDPGEVENAVRVAPAQFTSGASVMYTCQNGFTIQGGVAGQTIATIVCLSNGQWTVRPVCTATAAPVTGMSLRSTLEKV